MIDKYTAMKGTWRLLRLLSEDQRELLRHVANCKGEGDHESVRTLLSEANEADVKFLFEKGIIWKDNERGARMNLLVSESLREQTSEEEDA